MPALISIIAGWANLARASSHVPSQSQTRQMDHSAHTLSPQINELVAPKGQKAITQHVAMGAPEVLFREFNQNFKPKQEIV
jgi:hypothetical protein